MAATFTATLFATKLFEKIKMFGTKNVLALKLGICFHWITTKEPYGMKLTVKNAIAL